MGLVLKILLVNSVFVLPFGDGAAVVYDNLNLSASLGVNCSETLDRFVTNVDYSVEDFTDYTQDKEEPKYPPDVPKSRHPRSIRRVLSWVGRGFNKVFNSPYIYNFYPIINYSVGKIMQHLPFLNAAAGGGASPNSPDYPQSSSQPNPQQVQQQQQMQQEYEEEMEKKQQAMQQKQQQAEARAKHAAEEKRLINERAKKLAAKYVELYFAKQAQSSPVTFLTGYNPVPQENFGSEGAPYIPPIQPPVYNPPVYDQAYPQPNYPVAAYPPVDNLPEPEPEPEPIPPVYNPVPEEPPQEVNYVNV